MLCVCTIYVICIITVLNLQNEIRKSCMREQNTHIITCNDGDGLRLSAVLKYIASSTSSHTGTNIILWDQIDQGLLCNENRYNPCIQTRPGFAYHRSFQRSNLSLSSYTKVPQVWTKKLFLGENRGL